ncbi:hypothetical protein Q31b_55680 [Novipirellula aureliae]|uniref:Uncharacterized protein n=1 Tax=Novipirellula aureliae TaxID=2527966 RepID=A0A5C6DE72_9BACT|nr:hypothetical protein [Novipirellula aureliae]TWU34097.1 hypothetical protein Q31b_55680 [Novipirellula aureliae]
MRNTFVIFCLAIASTLHADDAWVIDSQRDWQQAVADQSNLQFEDGFATPTAKEATLRSTMKSFDEMRSANLITIDQSSAWLSGKPVGQIGPNNVADAPVFLRKRDNDYWFFGRYKPSADSAPVAPAELNGFDVPLMTNPHPFMKPLPDM